MILDLGLDHQLTRHERCARIILLDEAVQDDGLRVLRCNAQIKMLPADHFAAADKKDLYDCIRRRYGIVRILKRQCQHVLILAVSARDLLAL